MTRFRYTGHNGRVGEADSPYFAIAQAIGRPAADNVEISWREEREYSQRGDIADIFDDDGVIGRLVNLG